MAPTKHRNFFFSPSFVFVCFFLIPPGGFCSSAQTWFSSPRKSKRKGHGSLQDGKHQARGCAGRGCDMFAADWCTLRGSPMQHSPVSRKHVAPSPRTAPVFTAGKQRTALPKEGFLNPSLTSPPQRQFQSPGSSLTQRDARAVPP